MANAITFVEILTPNSAELADFYRSVFDWDVYPPMGSMEYRVMNPKAENGVMGAIGDPYTGERWVAFYVGVEDIDATIEKVVQNGGSVRVPKFTTDTGFTQAMVQDTQGHVIGLQALPKR